MNIARVAAAFAAGKSAQCHNAYTNGRDYFLHGHRIASHGDDGNVVRFDWCRWYTKTTANHMNHILRAVGSNQRVSYAAAAKAGEVGFHAARAV